MRSERGRRRESSRSDEERCILTSGVAACRRKRRGERRRAPFSRVALVGMEKPEEGCAMFFSMFLPERPNLGGMVAERASFMVAGCFIPPRPSFLRAEEKLEKSFMSGREGINFCSWAWGVEDSPNSREYKGKRHRPTWRSRRSDRVPGIKFFTRKRLHKQVVSWLYTRWAMLPSLTFFCFSLMTRRLL